MDLGFLIGLPLGFFAIIFSIAIGGFPFQIFISVVSVFITIVGSFAALMVGAPLKRIMSMGTYVGLCLREPKSNIPDIIKTLVSFSEKSRREGLLSLEDEIESLQDDFFKQGIRLVVDGTDPEVIKSIMYNQLNQMNVRHSFGIKLFDDWGKLAPAFGMIGTLYGLVGMLSTMGDPSAIGKGMSAALITTFYGAILANLILIPVKNKLSDRDLKETTEKEIILEGILSIQTGDNPRIVEEKLLAFIPPKERLKVKQTSDI